MWCTADQEQQRTLGLGRHSGAPGPSERQPSMKATSRRLLEKPLRVGGWQSRPVLLMAFAFTVMADPVSSVAYAIEAALRGNLGLLLPTMGLVVVLIALVISNYHYLVARYPQGG